MTQTLDCRCGGGGRGSARLSMWGVGVLQAKRRWEWGWMNRTWFDFCKNLICSLGFMKSGGAEVVKSYKLHCSYIFWSIVKMWHRRLRVFTNLVDDMKSLIVLFTNMVECGKVKSMNAFFLQIRWTCCGRLIIYKCIINYLQIVWNLCLYNWNNYLIVLQCIP